MKKSFCFSWINPAQSFLSQHVPKEKHFKCLHLLHFIPCASLSLSLARSCGCRRERWDVYLSHVLSCCVIARPCWRGSVVLVAFLTPAPTTMRPLTPGRRVTTPTASRASAAPRGATPMHHAPPAHARYTHTLPQLCHSTLFITLNNH